MKIRYTDGPPKLIMGAAGTFVLNEYREVDDALARHILAKKSHPWEAEAKAAEPAGKPAGGKEK